MRNSPPSIIFTVTVGLIVLGLAVWMTAPATVTIAGTTYVVPRKAQFAPDLRSKGEVSLMLRGTDLAAHIPGFHAMLPTVVSDETFPADTPVQVMRGDDWESRRKWAEQSARPAPTSPDDTTPSRTLPGQRELAPGCNKMEGHEGCALRNCIFTYLDGGVTVQFWLQGDNIAFGPEVARYAVKTLERYRQR